MPDNESYEKCSCDLCTDSRRWDAIVESQSVDAIVELTHELRDRICDAEEELGIKKVILSGDWSTSDEYLLKGLRKFYTQYYTDSGFRESVDWSRRNKN